MAITLEACLTPSRQPLEGITPASTPARFDRKGKGPIEAAEELAGVMMDVFQVFIRDAAKKNGIEDFHFQDESGEAVSADFGRANRWFHTQSEDLVTGPALDEGLPFGERIDGAMFADFAVGSPEPPKTE